MGRVPKTFLCLGFMRAESRFCWPIKARYREPFDGELKESWQNHPLLKYAACVYNCRDKNFLMACTQNVGCC